MQKFELAKTEVELFRDLLACNIENLSANAEVCKKITGYNIYYCETLLKRLNSFLADDDESKWKIGTSVEVVRCEKCKFYQRNQDGGFYCKNRNIRRPNGCHPLDYCNEGKRKEQPKCLKS